VADISLTEMIELARVDTPSNDGVAREPIGPPPPFSLGWILDPVTTETFFRAHWEAEPLLVTRNDPDHFAELPGLDAVDEIVTATTSGSAGSIEDGSVVRTDQSGSRTQRPIRLLDNGIPDIQDVYRAYHNGHSVVVNHVDRRSAPVARLCRALESALHHRVGANMYLTPQGGQGFPLHIDNHDVFILQLHGAKEWRVGSPPGNLPLADTKYGPVEFTGDARVYTLAPGDALYLPRGFPHEAVTTSSSSLHLTIGIHAFTWADLLSEALHLLAHEQVEFRVGLPPGFLDTPIDSAQLSKLAADLASALVDESLAERAMGRLGARLLGASKAANRGQFRSIDAISSLTGESVARRAPGFLCRVRSTSGRASIEFATNYVSGPLRLEPAMKFIEEHERFAVGDLPGQISNEDKVSLVGRLVSEGLLTCNGEKQGGKFDG
jgi:bifunctional lysine-specific demethylase and histidyl-hydroxylase NO66